jgi:hypothetical protein
MAEVLLVQCCGSIGDQSDVRATRLQVLQQMRDQAKAFSVEDMSLEHMITGTSSQGPGA